MEHITQINAARFSELSFQLIHDFLMTDFTGSGDIAQVAFIDAKTGKAMLTAWVNHVEESYEYFLHVPCFAGEDGKPVYVTKEGRMVDSRAYVQRREVIKIGSEQDVDAYIKSLGDAPVEIQIKEGYWVARRAENERRAQEEEAKKKEFERLMADPEILASEQAFAKEYNDHAMHLINAIRKRCSAGHLIGIAHRANESLAQVRYHKELLGTARLYKEDISAGWDAYRELKYVDYTESQDVLALLNMHKSGHGLSLGRAIRLMCYAYNRAYYPLMDA